MAEKPVGQIVQEARAALAQAEQALRRAIAALPDGPERGRLIQEHWSIGQMLGRHRRYFSQAGQDEFLDRVVFKGRRGGIFVEIGAYDGVTGSNTLFFEMFRGWSGLLVEASPTYHAEVLRNRDIPCLHVAVAPEVGEAEFLDIRKGYQQMGGLTASLGPTARRAIEADPRTEAALIRVPTRPLAEILAGQGLSQVDYLSIDIEGGELPVLAAFPFAQFDIAAWSIEVNEATPEIARIMGAADYRLAAHIGVDQIWVRDRAG
ncbi:MAG TPA: FkbM family methyltransferase [Paracoccaceae bacterium]|nr:FkbM family methyltransferase [Paracoccaceae bacterium]